MPTPRGRVGSHHSQGHGAPKTPPNQPPLTPNRPSKQAALSLTLQRRTRTVTAGREVREGGRRARWPGRGTAACTMEPGARRHADAQAAPPGALGVGPAVCVSRALPLRLATPQPESHCATAWRCRRTPRPTASRQQAPRTLLGAELLSAHPVPLHLGAWAGRGRREVPPQRCQGGGAGSDARTLQTCVCARVLPL